MAGGGYRGGSTIIHTGNSKKGVASSVARKRKRKLDAAPGLHVLSKEERKAVMKKVWASRRKSEAMARRKKEIDAEKRSRAFSKFVLDVKKVEG